MRFIMVITININNTKLILIFKNKSKRIGHQKYQNSHKF